MSSRKRQDTRFILLNITVAAQVAVMFLLIPSCMGKGDNVADAISERDSLPGMKTLGVTTFISDSGITRYKIITEEWSVFDKKDPPYWAFEKGVYLEKFDTLFRIDASIKADTAYYYENQKLWELRSNVHIRNQKGDKFDTDLLFWDEKDERVYSHRFIRIEQEDRIVTGYGFTSNQQMTEYQIYNNTGIFLVEDTAPADSTQAETGDTLAAAPRDSMQAVPAAAPRKTTRGTAQAAPKDSLPATPEEKAGKDSVP